VFRVQFEVIEKIHFKSGLILGEMEQNKTVSFDPVTYLKEIPEIPVIKIGCE